MILKNKINQLIIIIIGIIGMYFLLKKADNFATLFFIAIYISISYFWLRIYGLSINNNVFYLENVFFKKKYVKSDIKKIYRKSFYYYRFTLNNGKIYNVMAKEKDINDLNNID